MSKRKSNSKQRRSQGPQRVTVVNSTRRVPATPARTFRVPASTVLQTEDLRSFHPLQDHRPIGGLSRLSTRVVQKYDNKNLGRSPSALATDIIPRSRAAILHPDRTALCVRRHQRQQVLFARGIAGGSTHNFKRKRISRTSAISCGG